MIFDYNVKNITVTEEGKILITYHYRINNYYLWSRKLPSVKF